MLIEFLVYYAFSNLILYIIGKITRNLIPFLDLISDHFKPIYLHCITPQT